MSYRRVGRDGPASEDDEAVEASEESEAESQIVEDARDEDAEDDSEDEQASRDGVLALLLLGSGIGGRSSLQMAVGVVDC